MFVRVKPSGPRKYLQIVRNYRENGRTKQQVLATLGRLDRMQKEGDVDVLMRSLSRFAEGVRLQELYRTGDIEAGAALQIGPDLVFGKLWRETGIERVLRDLLRGRNFSFPVERAIYLTVLHRLFEAGSDRRATRWRRDVRIPGTEEVSLHHLYRAMGWLGERKENVEEHLFRERRTLFTQLTLAFFDTTSLYFEGAGGETLGQYGFSKDHRPDLRQMVLGAVLDNEGRPICTDMQPGNTADLTAFLPVVDRLRRKFGVTDVCWVADRGMISQETIEELEKKNLRYILGARMRKQKEVRDTVLARAGRFHDVAENLRVKEVMVQGRRYVVCRNPDQAAKDRADRGAILSSLEEQLRSGAKTLVGNRGYRKFLSVERGAVTINSRKIREEERYDGLFVLRTNTDLPTEEVALQYKRLLMVERFFRDTKSLLDTRPIFHQCDDTIKGHVFCSFLALVLRDELQRRLARRGWKMEWAEIVQDLRSLQEMEVRDGRHRYLLRTALQGIAGKVLQAAHVAIPAAARPLDSP
jgi:hypothetical protein